MEGTTLARVLLIGYDPRTEDDFSAPDRPPGETAESIQAGIERGVQRMRDRGWMVDVHLLDARKRASELVPALERELRAAHYDCVVIGGGVRRPKNYLTLEAVLNAVRKASPMTAFALNMGPENSAEAAARYIAE